MVFKLSEIREGNDKRVDDSIYEYIKLNGWSRHRMQINENILIIERYRTGNAVV